VSTERRIEKLRRDHAVDDFDCGREELNRCLKRYALLNQQAGAARTYVGLAADIAGIRAFAVHAKGESVKRFYARFDFIPSPTDPPHLFVRLKDVRSILNAG